MLVPLAVYRQRLMELFVPTQMGGGLKMEDVVALGVYLIVVSSAVLLAVARNPRQPLLMGFVAFLFPEVYVFQAVFRGVVLRTAKLC